MINWQIRNHKRATLKTLHVRNLDIQKNLQMTPPTDHYIQTRRDYRGRKGHHQGHQGHQIRKVCKFIERKENDPSEIFWKNGIN